MSEKSALSLVGRLLEAATMLRELRRTGALPLHADLATIVSAIDEAREVLERSEERITLTLWACRECRAESISKATILHYAGCSMA